MNYQLLVRCYFTLALGCGICFSANAQERLVLDLNRTIALANES